MKITTPKNKTSNRVIPMPKALRNSLELLLKENKKLYNFNNNFYVFGNVNPVGESMIRDRRIRISKDAGIKQIRLHDFRHSTASLLINNGANVTLVAKYLGHAKIDETLNTYSHMFKNKLTDLIDIIDNLGNN